MPDTEGPEKKREKREFMREKIVKQPMSKREAVKRLAAFFCFAVLFGAIAAVSFVMARPLADRYLGVKETAESTSIRFTRDEPETQPSQPSEEETPPAKEEEERIQKVVDEALEEYRFTLDGLNAFYGIFREIGLSADKSVVTVCSGKQQLDVFGNPVENTGNYAGAVIAKTPSEIFVFTCADAVRQADSILVAFSDGARVAGSVKQIDEVMNMAVVSVGAEELPPETMEGTEILALGNSYTVKAGDPVVGIGGPTGTVHSMTFGAVSYVERNVHLTDGMARVLHADLSSNAQTGTFLLNTAGELIGWAATEYNEESCTAQTAAVGISDYKTILERLTNGVPSPYFGVRGQEISEAMSEEGIPRGVYVTEAVAGGPAYNAGIQNGDIITQFGEKELTTFKELQTQIENAQCETTILVKVMRRGREDYTELEYSVDIRAR